VNDQMQIRHEPASLRQVPPAEVRALVEAGRTGRLVLYLGAGVSMSSPACGPRGNAVADRLRPYVAELLGVDLAELREPDLERLAARVEQEAVERLDQLKVRAAAAWGFHDMNPNYGHEMVALLLREGLATVVSANWDCGVENGGLSIGVSIKGVSGSSDRLNLPTSDVPIYKVHGCAKRPRTLVLTRGEVNEPRNWAQTEVKRGLTAGIVAFVGLGTLGTYVSEPVQELAELWTEGTSTVVIVDPDGPSAAWHEALGDQAHTVSVMSEADKFLDDLVRGSALEALSRAAEEARRVHAHEANPWSEAIVKGCVALRAAFANSHGDAVLRWWRDGVKLGEGGRQFIFERAGQVSLMCVAQLGATDGDAFVVNGTDGNLTVRSDRRYFEIACTPGAHRTDVERDARARIDKRRRDGRYATGVPIAVSVHGADGAFPAPSAPVDIATGDLAMSDIAAAALDGVSVFRAEDTMNGVLIA